MIAVRSSIAKPLAGMSFRLKLMLSMTFLAGSVALGSVYFAEEAIGRIYRGFMGEQFAREVERFREQEQARLAPVLEKVDVALSSVRLIAALRAESAQGFYSDLRHDLRFLFEEQEVTPYIRFLDVEGRILHPVEAGFEPLGAYLPGQFERIAELLKPYAGSFTETQTGYLPVADFEGRDHFFQVIAAPFVDFYTDEPLGLLALAVAIPSHGEVPAASRSRILSALHAEGVFHAPGLSRDDLAQLSPLLGAANDSANAGVPELRIGGTPHLVFFRSIAGLPGFPRVDQISLFSLQAFYDLLGEVRLIVTVFGLLAVGAGLGLSLIFSHTISRPLQSLMRGVKAVEEGNLEVRVSVPSRDEIGQLAHAFNEMTTGLALKEKYRDVLGKVTDPDVAEELMRGSLQLGGELRTATVLFCDIRGFTACTENMPPNEVIEMLNEHMTALTSVVQANHGVVDKFVGDEIMVLFGAPKSYPHDADNALRCARAMLQERQRLDACGPWRCPIGIGLATGAMVAGCMGSFNRLQYTVLGDKVNLAARLCGKARAGEILLDEATCRGLQDVYSISESTPLELKGFSKTIPVWSLTLDSNSQENPAQ